MKYFIKLFATLALLLLQATFSLAQQDLTFHFIENSTLSYATNPAFNVYQGKMIGFLNTNLAVSNSSWALGDFAKYKNDKQGLYKLFSDKNYVNINADVDLVYYQWLGKKFTYSVNYSQRATLGFSYSKDFFKLLWDGNAAYVGQNVAINGLTFDNSFYNELGFGIAQGRDNFNYGVRLKYLMGMSNIQIKQFDVNLFTDDRTAYQIQATPNIEVNASGFRDFNRPKNENPNNITFSDNLFRPKNAGLGLDLGFTYLLGENIDLNLSVINAFGFINWQENAINYSNQGNQIEFKGVSANKLDSILKFSSQQTLDSLTQALKLKTKKQSYTTMLVPRIYLSGLYYINEKSRVGLLFTKNLDGYTLPTITASINRKIKKHLNAILSYSIINNRYDNIGLGASLEYGRFQMNVVADNVMGAIFPTDYRFSSIRFGFAMKIGKQHKNVKGLYTTTPAEKPASEPSR